jgi:photosystem II stability/assembly factor-like uncharacterized protein
MNKILPLLALLITNGVFAQYPVNPVKPTAASERISNLQTRNLLREQSLISDIVVRNVGPTVMGGRVTDLEVDPADATHFYVAFASGGLWETKNNGQSFEPLFDNNPTLIIGDFTVHWPSKTIYVGTGEVNSSRSSYSGLGVYRSTDNGKNWLNIGLHESHHIGKIVIHPENPDMIWVAVLGHLYSPNSERGVFQTTNGGKTWMHCLPVNWNTGAVDLVMDPEDPLHLYAAIWERTRRAWNFWEGGSHSGIMQTIDGGKSWSMVTDVKNGFPSGEHCGRIGLAMFSKDGKKVLYALVDNQQREPDKEKKTDKLVRKDFKEMSAETFKSIPDTALRDFLKDNGFDKEYTVAKVRKMISKGDITPLDLYKYLTDANAELFDDPVIGAQLYRSEDGGLNWKKTHEESIYGVCYSYGYYFGLVRVAAYDADEVYIAGVPLLRSTDGGKTFEFIGGDNVHVDHHALWVNPDKKGHLINGNDGGLVISYDYGEHWMRCHHPPVGQFYTVFADDKKPYNIYGGLQDNGVWKGPSTYSGRTSWQQYGKYPYQMLLGGDGMQVAVDKENDIVYTGFQFGHYFRLDQKMGASKPIQPKHKLGEEPLRFNWQTPIWLSVHNSDILYLGSNKLHRSLNRGIEFEAISSDLTKGGQKGDVSFGTLTSIHESPLKFGWLVIGTDDGLVKITKDGGETWLIISDKLPQNLWVSRVRFSKHKKDRIFVALNGYRWDDFNAYIYMSDDMGLTWQTLGKNLPKEPVNVVIEDPENEDLLYVGTDNGLYVSIDKGENFMSAGKDLPPVAIHDLFVQETSGDLVIGTHGRSVYVMPLKELQKLSEIRDSFLVVFELPEIIKRESWGKKDFEWKYDEPEIRLAFYSSQTQTDSALIRIRTSDGFVLNSFKTAVNKGINSAILKFYINADSLSWPANISSLKPYKSDNGKYYLPISDYRVFVESNGIERQTLLRIKKEHGE